MKFLESHLQQVIICIVTNTVCINMYIFLKLIVLINLVKIFVTIQMKTSLVYTSDFAKLMNHTIVFTQLKLLVVIK